MTDPFLEIADHMDRLCTTGRFLNAGPARLDGAETARVFGAGRNAGLKIGQRDVARGRRKRCALA